MMIIAVKGATMRTMIVMVVLMMIMMTMMAMMMVMRMMVMMMKMMMATIKLTIEIKERLSGERNIKVSPRQHPLELATLLPLYF